MGHFKGIKDKSWVLAVPVQDALDCKPALPHFEAAGAVSAGWAHCAAISSAGDRVLSWGSIPTPINPPQPDHPIPQTSPENSLSGIDPETGVDAIPSWAIATHSGFTSRAAGSQPTQRTHTRQTSGAAHESPTRTIGSDDHEEGNAPGSSGPPVNISPARGTLERTNHAWRDHEHLKPDNTEISTAISTARETSTATEISTADRSSFVTEISTATLSLFACPAGMRLRLLACGEQHTVCVLACGMACAWGRGALGQLGHGGRDDASSPRPFKFANTAIKNR
jgi:hypothetical protein